MFYNWYDPSTGAKLTVWPDDGSIGPPVPVQRRQRLAGDRRCRSSSTRCRRWPTRRTRCSTRWTSATTTTPRRTRSAAASGSTRRPAAASRTTTAAARRVHYTCHHYGAFNTEPRMASYLGIAAEQIPQRHYFGTWRTFPPDRLRLALDRAARRRRVARPPRRPRLRGRLPYRGMQLVPTWGGSMFEALMVPLFVPEEQWGTQELGARRTRLRAGPDRARHGRGQLRLLGLLAVEQPRRGLPRVRRRPDRHGAQRLRVRPGADHRRRGLRASCRPAQPAPTVVRPGRRHAARVVPRAALRPEGVAAATWRTCARTSVPTARAVSTTRSTSSTGEMSKRYLSLDQGMVMAALGNALADDVMRRSFSQRCDGAAGRTAHAHGGVRRGHREVPVSPTEAGGAGGLRGPHRPAHRGRRAGRRAAPADRSPGELPGGGT